MTQREDSLYRALARAVWLAASLFVGLWLLDTIMPIVLVFAFAAILAIALNRPVMWLEANRVPRVLGAIFVMASVLAVAGILGWLIVPHLTDQVTALGADLPEYASALVNRLAVALADSPAAEEQLRFDADMLSQLLPTVQAVATRVGRYTLSLVGVVVFVVVLITSVVYMLANPRPLLRGVLLALPVSQRDPTARAFARASMMVGAWLGSNLIVGSIEAVAVAIALTLLGVPGVFVWAALAFFAEFVPKLGPYLMGIPPLLVALAVDPWTALWVLVFYVILNEVMGDVVTPAIRGSQMDMHPVVLLFAALAMATAFGLLGALIATPLAGFVKAFYEEFYLARQPADVRLEERVGHILERRVDGHPAEVGHSPV